MARTGIVTDSSCDLPAEVVAEHGIAVVPLTVRFGSTEYVDGVDLTSGQFWRLCRESDTLPATAAPAPGAFEQAYRSLAEQGADGVVAITLSGELSATVEAASAGARPVGDVIPVEVVDSRSVSVGLGSIVLQCARAAADGAGAGEVADLARSLAGRTRVFAALDTLENLKKGGRIGSAQAALGSLLSIKPLIEIADGAVQAKGRQRTRSRALAWLVDTVRSEAEAGNIERLAVMSADCDDRDEFVERLRPYYGGDILVGEIGAVIGTHSGPGTLGVVFQTPER